MKSLLLLLIVTCSAFGQLDYSPASKKESAWKMHLAIKLFRGVNQEQENFLLRAIRDRRSISEAEAAQLFTRDELRDVFFGVGRANIPVFRTVYAKGKLAEKKAVIQGLSRDEKIDLRRVNFAWGIGHLNLNDQQIDLLLRLSRALPMMQPETSMTPEQETAADLFQSEALSLFPKEVGFLLFGSVGPYTDEPCRTGNLPVKQTVRSAMLTTCPCNIGSSFNMQCNNECSTPSPGACNQTDSECGFMGLYACNGNCDTGEPINN